MTYYLITQGKLTALLCALHNKAGRNHRTVFTLLEASQTEGRDTIVQRVPPAKPPAALKKANPQRATLPRPTCCFPPPSSRIQLGTPCRREKRWRPTGRTEEEKALLSKPAAQPVILAAGAQQPSAGLHAAKGSGAAPQSAEPQPPQPLTLRRAARPNGPR